MFKIRLMSRRAEESRLLPVAWEAQIPGPTARGRAVRRIREWRAAIAEGGLPRRRRWQLIAAVAAFYLVRDLLLYVALPALVWLRAR